MWASSVCYKQRCAIWGRILINAINPWVCTRNRLQSWNRHTQNQKIFTFMKPISSTQFQSSQPITMEYLTISSRMAPRWARATKLKWAYCLLWNGVNGTYFYKFCKTGDPRSGHWPEIDDNHEILFGQSHQDVLQLGTPQKKTCF